jgi:hypothetical protein
MLFIDRNLKKQIKKMGCIERLDRKQPENLLGYSWDSVSSRRHEPGNKYCILYDNQGRIIDKLNLDRIIQNQVEKLSEYLDTDPYEIKKET